MTFPAIVTFLIVALEGAAFAAPSAEELFDQGQTSFAKGDYASAVAKWSESYRLSKEPELLFMIAQALENEGQCAEALATYRRFIAIASDSEHRPLADKFVRELTPKCETSKAATHESRESLWRPDTLNTPSASPQPSPVAEPRDDRAEHPTGMFTTRRKVAIGVATLSTASLVTAIVLGTTANNKKNDAFALCPDPQTPCADAGRAYDLTVSGHNTAIAADVMFGCAGAAAIVAGVLWFTGAQDSPRRLAIAPTSQGVVMLGRF